MSQGTSIPGNLRIAIVHDWLVNYAGSERVLEQILLCFPRADLYSVVDFVPESQRAFLQGKHPTTTFIQRLPGATRHYRHYLPLMPLAIEQLDLSSYDLIISSSHAVAKGVLVGPDQIHISYVHSPIRYAWDLQHQYLRESGLDRKFSGHLARLILHYLRLWDTRTAHGVDHFIANSAFIARRIRRVYGRSAHVIHPPVDVQSFSLHEAKDDFYLAASRMVPYKKMDLIVEAFTAMPEKKLVVIGDGPDLAKAKSKAGPNVAILGYQSFEVLRDHMQRARAFVFAAEEDFGITPVEAQACGTPVIAYGKGGALETVRGVEQPRPTGILFPEQSKVAIIAAVKNFEKQRGTISAQYCRHNAECFSSDLFRKKLLVFVSDALEHTPSHTQSGGQSKLTS